MMMIIIIMLSSDAFPICKCFKIIFNRTICPKQDMYYMFYFTNMNLRAKWNIYIYDLCFILLIWALD